jgi:hypothetical protein
VVFSLTQEASALAFSEGVAASDGRFGGKMETLYDWQNLSIQLSESVILGELNVVKEVTILHHAIENTEFLSKRTSDFRHLGLWPFECDSNKRVGQTTKNS